jgi:hypothetical protein
MGANFDVQKIGKYFFRITFATSGSRCLPNAHRRRRPRKMFRAEPSPSNKIKKKITVSKFASYKSWQNLGH